MKWIKLNSNIIESSAWEEPYHVRLVWLSLMAICDLDGIARISEAAVARIANVQPDEAKESMDVLLSPDPHSRDPDNEGRRIEKVPGGFKLLNYFKYRNIKNPKERANYMRDYMKKYREKKTGGKKLTWKDVYKQEADNAMALPIPSTFHPDIENGIINFLSMRYNLATEPARKQDRVRLTSAMVQALFEETKVALVYGNVSKVAQRLQNAAIAGFRNPNFNGFYEV